MSTLRASIKLLPSMRSYATINSNAKPLNTKGPALTLEHVRILLPIYSITISSHSTQFVQRSRALALWRDIVRTIRRQWTFSLIAETSD